MWLRKQFIGHSACFLTELFVYVFVIHTVNNVGMNYSDDFAFFLDTPNAENVSLFLM